MGMWAFYFFAKGFLYYKGFIRFNLIYNIIFAVILSLPLPEKYEYKALVAFRIILNIALCVALLWYDSWLSSPFDAINFLQSQGMPSKEYIVSFISGFINLEVFVVFGVILAACVLVNRYINMTSIVAIGFIGIFAFSMAGKTSGTSVKNSDQVLDAFFDGESQRMVHFGKSGAGPGFDVVILHICSLSTDDMREVGMANDSFFKQFNFLFPYFNTATSYSGPAVIRLLRASCGQPRHEDIYKEAPKDCFLFDNLAAKGYTDYLAFNHDGIYGNFAEDVKHYGRLLAPPLKQNDLRPALYMFDNSPIYDDYQVLEKWWRQRLQSKSDAALFYNTVTLHDGTHWAGESGWYRRSRRDQYMERLRKLLDNTNRFFNLMASSGRNVVVIFVPEHGMALSGSRIQAMGLRDLPLPSITQVPLGIKLIGPAFNGKPVEQKIISKSVSYFAMAQMIATLLEKNPFQSDEHYKTRQFLDGIPQTDIVSENLGMLIMRDGGKFFLYGKEKKWLELTEKELK